MEFLEIPLINDDFYRMMIRFTINISFLTVIIWFLYYKYAHRQNYLFTYYMIGIIVFFLCFTLKKFELDLGMALGLFAIFGILRYRTNPIEIKEMTYLFVIIGLSVVNSLANQKMSYFEIFGANGIIVVAIYLLERVWLSRQIESKKITYNKLDNIRPEDHEILIKELSKLTGHDVVKVKISSVNYVQKTASITIFFFPHQPKIE